MRARLSLLLSIVLVSAAGLACSAPPDKERQQAITAIDDARRADAGRYASSQLAAAEALMQKYDAAVAARDYRLALSSALEARETAAAASKVAASEKARASVAAQSLVVQVDALVRSANARLAPGATPRLSATAAERLRADVKVATTALQEARAAMPREDFAAITAALTPLVERLTLETAPQGVIPAGRGR